jgi:hypothetical protein
LYYFILLVDKISGENAKGRFKELQEKKEDERKGKRG